MTDKLHPYLSAAAEILGTPGGPSRSAVETARDCLSTWLQENRAYSDPDLGFGSFCPHCDTHLTIRGQRSGICEVCCVPLPEGPSR